MHPDIRLGPVSLYVQNLNRSIRYYHEHLGLRLLERNHDSARLGTEHTLMELVEKPSGRIVHGTTGLYHFALLVPTRLDLARVLRHLLELNTPIEGFADHLVSEAIYLADPDGNGIEIYRDRPRTEWPYQGEQLLMGTEPLDIDGLLLEEDDGRVDPEEIAAGTKVGHIHLKVSNVSEAEVFYTEILGFDLIVRYGPSASFVSTGGYHHHIGFNSWTSRGGEAPPEDSLGLRFFTINAPTQEDLAMIMERCRKADVDVDVIGDRYLVRDPSQNTMLLETTER